MSQYMRVGFILLSPCSIPRNSYSQTLLLPAPLCSETDHTDTCCRALDHQIPTSKFTQMFGSIRGTRPPRPSCHFPHCPLTGLPTILGLHLLLTTLTCLPMEKLVGLSDQGMQDRMKRFHSFGRRGLLPHLPGGGRPPPAKEPARHCHGLPAEDGGHTRCALA